MAWGRAHRKREGAAGALAAPGTRYVARAGGWFDAGTVVTVVTDVGDALVVMRGVRTCRSAAVEDHAVGTAYADEALCGWREFGPLAEDGET